MWPVSSGTDDGPRLFRDRRDAGARLAERLERYREQDIVVLGIPRGGVPVAAEVASRLAADLDLVVARKLGAPGRPELAIGAVTANGKRFLNADLLWELGVGERYLADVTARQQTEARQREERFRDGRSPCPIEGRTAIVVDDGLATGATMRAAVRSVRQRRPARLVVAVPVGAREACAALRAEADEVVCLAEPQPFWAVGVHYDHFEPTEDDEVQQLVRQAADRHRPPAKPLATPPGGSAGAVQRPLP
jgi:putative phosphoribosyl transferase